MITPLPIKEQIPNIRTALEQSRCAMILALPGTGKTTLVPLTLLEAPGLDEFHERSFI